MFVLLQIGSAAIGILLVSWSVFLYEAEERVIDETLAWWIEIDDLAQTAVKRNLAMLRIAARAVSGWLSGVFGERLLSMRAVSASLTLSVASLFLVGFVISLLDLLRERSNVATDIVGVLLAALLSAALFYVAVAPGRSSLRVAVATGIVLFLCCFEVLGRFLVGWSGFEMSAIPTTAMLAVFSDFVVVTLTRRVATRIATTDSIGFAVIATCLNGVAGALLIIAPLAVLIKSGPVSAPWFVFAVVMAGASNVFAAVIAFTLTVMFASLVLHRVFWPIIQRPLYALWRFKLLQNRKVLFYSGVVLLTVPLPRIAQVVKGAGALF
jgi:hypothetical protein